MLAAEEQFAVLTALVIAAAVQARTWLGPLVVTAKPPPPPEQGRQQDQN